VDARADNPLADRDSDATSFAFLHVELHLQVASSKSESGFQVGLLVGNRCRAHCKDTMPVASPDAAATLIRCAHSSSEICWKCPSTPKKV
jgi:hypothetical protein